MKSHRHKRKGIGSVYQNSLREGFPSAFRHQTTFGAFGDSDSVFVDNDGDEFLMTPTHIEPLTSTLLLESWSQEHLNSDDDEFGNSISKTNHETVNHEVLSLTPRPTSVEEPGGDLLADNESSVPTLSEGCEYVEEYFNMLKSVEAENLKLTSTDDQVDSQVTEYFFHFASEGKIPRYILYIAWDIYSRYARHGLPENCSLSAVASFRLASKVFDSHHSEGALSFPILMKKNLLTHPKPRVRDEEVRILNTLKYRLPTSSHVVDVVDLIFVLLHSSLSLTEEEWNDVVIAAENLLDLQLLDGNQDIATRPAYLGCQVVVGAIDLAGFSGEEVTDILAPYYEGVINLRETIPEVLRPIIH